MRVAEHGCFPPPFKQKRIVKASCLLSSTQSRCRSREWRKTRRAVPKSPPSLLTDDPRGPSASWERWIGGMGLTGPSLRERSLRVPTLSARVGTDILAQRALSALDPGHNLAHAPNTPCCSPNLRLCAQQPRAPSLRAPSSSGRLPGIRIKLPNGRAGASQALQPSPAPPPTCCLHSRFHLHLPLTLRPARTRAPHRPAPGPP